MKVDLDNVEGSVYHVLVDEIDWGWEGNREVFLKIVDGPFAGKTCSIEVLTEEIE